MADDKTKRGSPDNKRVATSQTYEMAHARRKAVQRTAATSKAPPKRGSTPRRPAKALDGSVPPPAARTKKVSGPHRSGPNTAPPLRKRGDAVDLLVDDHLAAHGAFKKYDKLVDAKASAADRGTLARSICSMLSTHTALEEEIFYPAARSAGLDASLLDEADVEHASAKMLMAQIRAGHADDEHFDAKVKVLGEYVNHHVVEEHEQMFPQCRRSSMDLAALRQRMEARKAELEARAGA